MVAPVLQELAGQYGDKLKITKVNVDEEPALAQKYNVMSIPTLIIFKDGKEIDQQIGFNGKEALVEAIDKALWDYRLLIKACLILSLSVPARPD